VRRLRALTEEECYLRCYGAGDATVTLVRLEPLRPPRAARARLTGEELRRLFEIRLDAREELAA
jgi:hypothetical protein